MPCLSNTRKGMTPKLINITKDEARTVREYYPDACIIRTRHKWHMEENERYLTLIPNNQQAAEILEGYRMRRARKNKRRQAMKAAKRGA